MRVFQKKRRCRFDDNWNLIVSTRQPELLIKRVDLHPRFGFNVEKVDWLNYWQEVITAKDKSEFCEKLELLRVARITYLANSRNGNSAKDYCRNFFELLHYAVHSGNLESNRLKVLRKLIGLETIPVYWQGSLYPNLIVVNTKSNPVYLLSRIHQSKSWNNLRFLPMVSYGSFDSENRTEFPLYHQYRQISGGSSESATLFTYIPVSIEARKNSFIAWQHLAASLTPKKDALIKTRSQCLSKQVLSPVVAQIPGFGQSPEKMLRIADLGGGSGDLTHAVLANFLTSDSVPADAIRVSLTIVDYDFPDMNRHLKRTAFFRSLASLQCQRKDFLDWIFENRFPSDKPAIDFKVKMSEHQASKQFDLIFMFRLLNNMSEFGISKAASWEDVRSITCERLTEQDWLEGKYYPHRAILENELENIVLSTKQISHKSQTTWCIASLTDYFQALLLLSRCWKDTESLENQSPKTIFFPTRKLDLNKIHYGPGRNLFEDLCRLCHFVLIEDVDLRSNDLRQYLTQHGLSRLKVIDLPSRIPSSNTFCVFEE